MKHLKTSIFILFITCLIAGASACNMDGEIAGNDKPVKIPNVVYTLDSFTINARDTGIVNNAHYLEWITSPDSNIHIEFDAVTSANVPRDVKYLEITYMKDNAVNFVYVHYNDEINRHHSFDIVDAFDKVILYIKIYNNYSLPAYIRMTNITATKF